MWREQDLPELQRLVQAVLGLDDRDFLEMETTDDLLRAVEGKLGKCPPEDIRDICFVLASKGAE